MWRPPAEARPDQTVGDVTPADFLAGSSDGGIHVSASGGGEIVLSPTLAAEFNGPGLPRGWSATTWAEGGTASVEGGAAKVDGARVAANALFGAGRALDFGATFTGQPDEDAGLGTDLVSVPWALFSTRYGGRLHARSHFHNEERNPIPGDWFGGPHRFRIDWNVLNLLFAVDDEVVVTQMVPIVGFMRPLASARRVGRGGVLLHWARLSPYSQAGTFFSRVLDAGHPVRWESADWRAELAPGTGLAFSIRTGDVADPDDTWTSWGRVSQPGAALDASARFLQYRAELATDDAMRTPTLAQVELRYRHTT